MKGGLAFSKMSWKGGAIFWRPVKGWPKLKGGGKYEKGGWYFWQVLSKTFGESIPKKINMQKKFRQAFGAANIFHKKFSAIFQILEFNKLLSNK